jgi:hypothetical protein
MNKYSYLREGYQDLTREKHWWVKFEVVYFHWKSAAGVGNSPLLSNELILESSQVNSYIEKLCPRIYLQYHLTAKHGSYHIHLPYPSIKR